MLWGAFSENAARDEALVRFPRRGAADGYIPMEMDTLCRLPMLPSEESA